MRKHILLVIATFVGCGLSCFFLGKQEKAATLIITNVKKQTLNSENNIKENLASVPVKSQLSLTNWSNDFESLNKTMATMESIESFISYEKKLDEIKKQGLDTVENFKESREVIVTAYPSEPDAVVIKKKVLALHLLKFSSHLESSDCTQFLEVLNEQYDNLPSTHYARNALQWDLFAVGKLCKKSFANSVQSFVDNTHNSTLKAQAQLSLK